MRPLLLATVLLCTVPAAAGASPNANVALLRGEATYSNGRDAIDGDGYYRDLAFTGTVTAVGTGGVPVTYACSLSGTVTSGYRPVLRDGEPTYANGESGTLTGPCGRFTALECSYVRQYIGPAWLSCHQGDDAFFGYSAVLPPVDPQYVPFAVWDFPMVDATNS